MTFNLLQYIIFDAINHFGIISIQDLSDKLMLNLKQLGNILNILLEFKLIKKSDGPTNDPNLLLTTNDFCVFDQTEVNLSTFN